MEMEGRGLYKNSSEELFLKTVMESPIGMPVVPTMEMLGFKALSQSFRTDSEELFKSWLRLTNEEGYNSSSKGPNSRLSQRMSPQLANSCNQENAGVVSEGRSTDKLQFSPKASDGSADFTPLPMRDFVDRELQSSNMFLAKAWFLSEQRMTRSRSSELRRRYAEIQNAQSAQGMESCHMVAPQHGADTIQQEVPNLNGYDYLSVCERPHQEGRFMCPSNSSLSAFNTHQLCDADKVSSCVSMLKGTLELRRLSSQVEEESIEHGSNGPFCPQDSHFKAVSSEEWSHQKQINVQGTSTKPSQSESSAAFLVVTTSLDACDGPSKASQTLSKSSWKQIGVSTRSENRVKGFREQMKNNLKDDSKRRLERYGSITSGISEDKGDGTKKRRVERSREMAEAKERNLTPSAPLDIQAVLKRCENLEKEIRSLKLNLSFMNRKDSDQTKQIEKLQKQNEDLADEKERLLEEIERIISETGKFARTSYGKKRK